MSEPASVDRGAVVGRVLRPEWLASTAFGEMAHERRQPVEAERLLRYRDRTSEAAAAGDLLGGLLPCGIDQLVHLDHRLCGGGLSALRISGR